ncbi:TIGR03086 family metal-binding protein [Pseudonocardia alaniniphila]|uniref:TIGR03086 family metal-binding protein n=1 Tax=Pseudonocardia alaniniphila TaxID=75291 RepID=A0ABS9TRW8_9PSEU|nr:TIGR03086 family metal-binding protein [Pseudonocardia alaniniphila]MCH6171262.1 TIGR03086 family metal-binding protein [Pseudonocardia alaniniphila]
MSTPFTFHLQGSLAYALDVVGRLVPGRLDDPTPCPGWDVRALVAHLTDSVTVLSGARTSRATADPDDPVPAFTEAVCLLLARLPRRASRAVGTSENPRSTAELATALGAIEVAVHGWDVARACGCTRPVPAVIAVDLLELVPALVPPGTRPGLFGAPVRVLPGAPPGDGLVAFMGRSPAWAPPAPAVADPLTGQR